MKYSELTRSEVPEFKSRIMEAKGGVTLKDIERFRDAYNLPSPRSEFFRLLNLGSVSE